MIVGYERSQFDTISIIENKIQPSYAADIDQHIDSRALTSLKFQQEIRRPGYNANSIRHVP